MAKLSQPQIAALWIKEGGDKGKADEASAVAMAESGGDTTIHTPGSCCYGLYQFNVEVHSATLKCATNASCSTKEAIKLSNNGTTWDGGRWEAHENGSYKQFLGKSGISASSSESEIEKLAKEAGGNLLTVAGGVPGFLGAKLLGADPSIPNPLSGIDAVGAAMQGIAKLIEDLFTARFWVRFGKGLLGAVLLVYALQGMLKATLGMEIPLNKLPIPLPV